VSRRRARQLVANAQQGKPESESAAALEAFDAALPATRAAHFAIGLLPRRGGEGVEALAAHANTKLQEVVNAAQPGGAPVAKYAEFHAHYFEEAFAARLGALVAEEFEGAGAASARAEHRFVPTSRALLYTQNLSPARALRAPA
jgi:hypothetical protein